MTTKGFRFEGQFLVGPSIRRPAAERDRRRKPEARHRRGPSFEVAADFRLPFLPDLHVRAAVGTDFVIDMMPRRTCMPGSAARWRWRGGSARPD